MIAKIYEEGVDFLYVSENGQFADEEAEQAYDEACSHTANLKTDLWAGLLKVTKNTAYAGNMRPFIIPNSSDAKK